MRTCSQFTIWESEYSQAYFSHDTFHHLKYKCRNCGQNRIDYWILWTEDSNYISLFEKVGQHPPPSVDPPNELAKALGKEDAALYKKALTNGAYSFGIGALSYFRRVIENKVNDLLDLIHEAASLADFHPDELARIGDVKGSHGVEEKIQYASKILPPHLRPGGHNSLDRLYAVASVGIRGKFDEECLDIFNDARFEFEYLFKNLVVENLEAREYLKRVSSPFKKA